MDDHERNDDGQHVHNTDDPDQHIGWVAVRRRDGFWLNRWLQSFFVGTHGGTVNSIATEINDEVDILGDFVACGIRGSDAQSVEAWLKISS